MKLYRPAVIALMSFILPSLAAATTYQRLTGTTIDVFYDVDFFGPGKVSMESDSLVVEMIGWTGSGALFSDPSTDRSKFSTANNAIVAVPHSGRLVSNTVDLNYIGTAQESRIGGQARLDWFVGVNAGLFRNETTFAPSHLIGGVFVFITAGANEGMDYESSFNLSSKAPNPSRWGQERYDVLGFPATYSSVIGVDITGSVGGEWSDANYSSLTLNTVKYEFSTIAAVPDISGRVSFLLGLGLFAGLTARRRYE